MNIKDPKIPTHRDVLFIDTDGLVPVLYEASTNYRYYVEDSGWMYNISIVGRTGDKDVHEKWILPPRYKEEIRKQLSSITIKYNQRRNSAITELIEDTWIKNKQECSNKN